MTFQFLASDAVSGSPAYGAGTWRLNLAALYVPIGPLAARTGALSVDSFAASLAGTTVSIGPGRALVQGATTAAQGAYQVTMPTTYSQALAAASSQDRIDLFYLRIWDNEVDASGSTQADIVYLQGTPSGSPATPTIPGGQAGMRICTVYVPHTGSPALTQVGVIPYTAAAGGIVPAYTTASPETPETGQVRWRADRAATVQPGPLELWSGAAWAAIVPDSYPRGMVGQQAPVTAIGTASSAGTETKDAVLGDLAVTLTAGRRYRVELIGLVSNATVAADTYLLNIRDGGNASPTSASTLIAQSPYHPSTGGIAGRLATRVMYEYVAGSGGTHTFGFFVQRTGGTGVYTPISVASDTGALGRYLKVEDIGL